MSKNPNVSENQESVNLEVQKILEEAKASAAKIIEEAKATADKVIAEVSEMKAQAELAKTTPAPAPKKPTNNEEYEEITLFKDGDKYKDDVTVCVNGERILIKRGVPVKIKKKFIKALKLSDQQKLAAATYMEEKSQEFEDESKRRNI